MLLDLRSLFEDTGDHPVISQGGYQRTRPVPAPKPAAVVHQDMGLLVSAAGGLAATWGGRRIQTRRAVVAAAGGGLAAVTVFKPAARWRDTGRLPATGQTLRGADTFTSGAPAIAAADDELMLGDF